jgi:hypothetical protein
MEKEIPGGTGRSDQDVALDLAKFVYERGFYGDGLTRGEPDQNKEKLLKLFADCLGAVRGR